MKIMNSNSPKCYLVFKIEHEEYAIQAEDVKDVIIASNYIASMYSKDNQYQVNQNRLFNIREKFGLTETRITDESIVITVNISIDNIPVKLGLLVDNIQNVLEIYDWQIGNPTRSKNKFKTQITDSVAVVNERIIHIIDKNKLLTNEVETPFVQLTKQVFI